MKKIITSIFLLFISTTFLAQDNWDTVATGGLAPYQSRFYDMLQYNGKIYAASDSGYQVPYLYSSSTGSYGSWQTEDSLRQFLQVGSGMSEDILSRLATDGTYLFIGSANYSGGFQTPQVYRYDGTNYKKHGFISYSGSPYNYSDISAMEFFSATGAPDSIFAFVTSWTGLEIWKTSASSANPTWVPSLITTGNTYYVNDAIVNNGKMFAATCGGSNGGFILRTNNGMVWDTVGNNGLGDHYNYYIKSLGVYKGALYAGTSNDSSGAKLYRSVDDGATWNNVSLASLGFGLNLRSVSDIKVVGGRMFLVLREKNAGYNYLHVVYTNDGNNYQSSGTGTFLESTQMNPSTFGEYRLEAFNGGVYTTGPTNTNYGAISRLMLPVASFTPSAFTACQNQLVSYSNTSTNATSFAWYDGNVGGSTNFSDTYATAGIAHVQLNAYNGTIWDSVSANITIAPNPILNGVGATVNSCANMTYNLGDFVQATGGTPPYSFDWWNGPTHFYSVNPSYSPTTSLTFTISVTDANGCAAPNGALFFPFGNSTDLRGHVTIPPTTNADFGLVYAFKKHPGSTGLDTAAITPLINGTGDYLFTALDSGSYYVKAIPDTAFYPNSISTYFGNAFRWDSSTVVVHQCIQTDTADIQVLLLPAQTGSASISGNIVQGAGFGMRYMNNGGNLPIPFAPGGPIRGVDVKLGKNPGGGIQARTFADTNGLYVFTHVPVGTYKIYVDIPNLPMDSTRNVTIVNPTDSLPNNNYWADSARIYIPVVVAVKEITVTNSAELRTFPNPAKDQITVLADVNKETTLTYELRDLTGKIIQSSVKHLNKGKNTVEINLQNDIKPGMYLMNYYIDSSRYITKLIVAE